MYAGSDTSVFGGNNTSKERSCSEELERKVRVKNRMEFEILGRVLDNTRVYLTPLSNNADIYAMWINDPAISSMLGRADKVVTVDGQADFIRHCNGKPYFDINVSDGFESRHVGVCNLVVLDDASHHAIVGIYIGNKEWHGKGVGKAAVEMLLEMAFDRMNMESVSLTVVETNKAAINCYKKCGFVEQGIQRNRAYINGEYKNLVYMDITKLEYRYRKNQKHNEDEMI